MSERVRVSIRDGVADVRLNRPEKMNAMDLSMFLALIETGEDLARDASLRSVLLSGEGRAFCAGIDTSSFAGGQTKDGAPINLLDRPEGSVATYAQLAAKVWTDLPVPVIAAVHGVAFGAGIQLALAADIRFVAPDARLSVMEIKWGLIPDVTASQTLRRLVRLDVAKDLTFTGREVRGSEAVEIGLATYASPDPLAAARAMAEDIASRSPDAIRAGKQLLEESGFGSRDDGLRLEAELQRGIIGRPNQVETVRSVMEKRKPDYVDPS